MEGGIECLVMPARWRGPAWAQDAGRVAAMASSMAEFQVAWDTVRPVATPRTMRALHTRFQIQGSAPCGRIHLCSAAGVLVQVEQEILQRHLRRLERRIARPAQLRRSGGPRLLHSGRAGPGAASAVPQGASAQQHSLSGGGRQGGLGTHAPDAYMSSSLSWSDSDEASHLSDGPGAPQGPAMCRCGDWHVPWLELWPWDVAAPVAYAS